MSLAKHIQDLLYRYECVIVPGFGAFLSQREAAVINSETNTLLPPTKTISFNRQLLKNDGLLANYVAETEKVSYSTALTIIADFVHQIEVSLKTERKADLENIGQFSISEEDTLQFEPANTVNYLTDAFGLAPVQATKITPKLSKEVVSTTKTNTDKELVNFTPKNRATLYKYAAVGIIAVGLSGILGLNFYSSNVQEHNIAEQQEAETKLEQQIQEATFVIDNPLPAITFKVENQPGNFHVVAGAFRMEENAEKKVAELKKEGYKARLIGQNKYGLHQVVYSSHKTRRDATNALIRIKKTNKAAWLLVEEL